MNSDLNPYSPGSGRRHSEITGREAGIQAFDVLIAKTKQRSPDRGVVLHGFPQQVSCFSLPDRRAMRVLWGARPGLRLQGDAAR